MSPEEPQLSSDEPSRPEMRWTQRQTKVLFSLIKEKWLLFEDTDEKRIIWKSIAKEMVENHGINVTKDQCSGRWKTLKAAFQRVKDHNNKTGMMNYTRCLDNCNNTGASSVGL